MAFTFSTRPACCGRASSWPRAATNLAASGAIGRNAFNEEEVALELLDYLIPNYPDLLKARYKVELPAGTTDEQLLEGDRPQAGRRPEQRPHQFTKSR
jgi:hypothetical protein